MNENSNTTLNFCFKGEFPVYISAVIQPVSRDLPVAANVRAKPPIVYPAPRT